EQFNLTSYAATSVAIVSLEAFSGMWINAFLVSVLCISWVKQKTLNLNEKILLFLGFSRFWYLSIEWLHYSLSIIYPNYLYVHPTFQVVASTTSFFNFSSLWVSACLCVFYCLKIANFSNRFFIYLKAKIDRIVPALFFGSVLFSLILSIFIYSDIDKAICKNHNCTSQGSIWKPTIRIEEHFFTIFFVTGFLFAVSFMAVIFSALLLLFSLWRHQRNMQTNCMKDLSMDAHIRAMKSILSFFIMYSINFILLILTQISALNTQSLDMFPFFVGRFAFPGVHSLILIFSNPKLEKILRRILCCGNCK
ncbi:TA2R9 protein, partial [Serilophus lunatus]|nr:TA2R9 protein [Serilophus lunatus]